MALSLAILQLSSGDWTEGVDESTLPQADKDLLFDNAPVITYYSEDTAPTNYADRTTITNWVTLTKKYAGADHLLIKLGLKHILNSATGANEQEKFDTFTIAEREHLIMYNAVVDGAICVGYYVANEEGFDVAIATDYYGAVKLQSMDKVAKSCNDRYEKKGVGWYPIFFSFFDEPTAFAIRGEIDQYKSGYTEDGLIGSLWGDSINGFLDYIQGTGGVDPKLEDHAVLEGKTIADAKNALTQYFHQRYPEV